MILNKNELKIPYNDDLTKMFNIIFVQHKEMSDSTNSANQDVT